MSNDWTIMLRSPGHCHSDRASRLVAKLYLIGAAYSKSRKRDRSNEEHSTPLTPSDLAHHTVIIGPGHLSPTFSFAFCPTGISTSRSIPAGYGYDSFTEEVAEFNNQNALTWADAALRFTSNS